MEGQPIYYIIDAINDAINAGKQISFQYYDYTGLKKKVLKNKGEVYKLSPYKLLWCGDYYYVLGYSEKKSKVINFRVDRIASKPEILDKYIIPMPDDFDIENYTKEVFFMFSGEKVLVDLRCDNSLMKTMVDRFGEDVTTLAYDMTSFRVQTEVSASPTFFGWVFGFNGKVQILAPESVKEQYRQMIAKADEDTLVYYDHRTSEGKKGCYFNVNTPKTEAGNRQVPMLDFVKEAFVMEKERQELLGVHCEATIDGYTDFIFLNRFGQPQHQSTLNKAIRRIIRDCNDEQFLKTENPEVLLPHFSCHSLRHTFTTRMCEAGVNIKVIQDTLGHKDITTTLNIYTDVTKELKRTEFDGLDKYFNNSIA